MINAGAVKNNYRCAYLFAQGRVCDSYIHSELTTSAHFHALKTLGRYTTAILAYHGPEFSLQ